MEYNAKNNCRDYFEKMKKEKISMKETKEFKELYKNISAFIRKSGLYSKRKRKTVKD